MIKPSAHIGFAVPSRSGHFITSLALARALISRGHRVTYIGTNDFADPITAAGAALIRSSSYGRVFTDPYERGGQVGAFGAATAEANFELGNDLDRLTEHFRADPLDVLCVNFISHLGYGLAETLSIPRVGLYPTFAVDDQLFAPVYGSFEPEPGERADRAAAWRRAGISPPEIMWIVPPADRLNLVSIPRSFQIGSERLDDTFQFIGPSLAGHTETDTWQPPGTDRPNVYISLGTVFNDNAQFFRRCLRELGDRDLSVAMSIGSTVDITKLGPIPSNFDVRPRFPQIAVLRGSDVFVSHVGTGSMMEAILTGVPIIGFPQNHEQSLYAAKLTELGLGRYPRDTECSLSELVAQTLESTQYRTNLGELRRQLEADDGIARGAGSVEALIAHTSLARRGG
ncbi:nucleotide disphospho-sugar-binding domain-containing protein [Nocardia sp. NPDC051052]|uniref:nucleotide disphospho-sugar-binding domain-containing protein n=1 Tax=Nocardia sp. NPDC051052 TaxID=3364322 RepID=UPI0037A59D6B